MAMTGAFLFLLWISVFLTPVCILFTWVKNVNYLTKEEVQNNWRQAVLFAAQVAVTAAAIPVWCYVFHHSDSAVGAQDRFQHKLFWSSFALALIGLVGSAAGKGVAKKVTVASSIFVILNWVALAAFA